MSSSKTNDYAASNDPVASEGLDLCGRTIADFRLLRKLGQGGMGQVYLAEQISLKRNVALKILRPDLAATTRALDRFKQEATALAKINHANIVQVYAFGVEDGLAYVALEYVEGKNLKEILAKKGPPDLPISLSIMRQVAAALQRASEHGIIHRDVKPENILVTRKTEVKVADFGLASVLEGDKPAMNLTQTGVTMGTPLYMSPEQVEGKPIDARTDVYSFGVTCYHLLSGEPPFKGQSAFEVALQHVQKQPVPLNDIRPDLPEALCSLVHKMMAKNKEDRYQNCKELLRDLSRLREATTGVSRTLSTRPPSSGEQPVAKTEITPTATPAAQTMTVPVVARGRRGLLVTVVLLTLLAAAGGGVAFAWVEKQRQGPLPYGQKIAPADAELTENLNLPSKEEQRLREMVEGYLNPPKGKQMDPTTGLGLCMELGLLYLDGNRLSEANAHFERLLEKGEPRSYRMLGQLGRGIVLALENKEKESNRYFREVFGKAPSDVKTLKDLSKFSKDKGKEFSKDYWVKTADKDLAPIAAVRQNPGWRYWIARARWYNAKNGLSENEVPFWLARHFSIKDGEVEPRPGPRPNPGKTDKDKDKRKDKDKAG